MVVSPSSRPDGSPDPRLGLTVSRKVGGAVVRNRVKRRVREWFRHSRKALPAGVDLVVIARRGAGELSTEQTQGSLAELAQRVRRHDR